LGGRQGRRGPPLVYPLATCTMSRAKRPLHAGHGGYSRGRGLGHRCNDRCLEFTPENCNSCCRDEVLKYGCAACQVFEQAQPPVIAQGAEQGHLPELLHRGRYERESSCTGLA
jgi:hypothetical protein